jgi:hypothetical protein
VGGFITHCGWDATPESISHGVPPLTWPSFADQFSSERLLVDVLGIGVRSGVKVPVMNVPEETEGVQLASCDVEKAIAELIDEARAGGSKAKELAEEARAAMAEDGSSYSDLTDTICYVSELSRKTRHEGTIKLDGPSYAFHGGRARAQQRREDRSRRCIVSTVLSKAT